MAKPDIWERYESVIRRAAPQTFERLRPPASKEAIAAAEKTMKVKFPKELRAAYERHDGFAIFKSFGGNSLAEMTRFWEMSCRIQEELEMEDLDFFELQQPKPSWASNFIRPVNWYKKWLPIASDGIRSVCIDLAPAPKGSVGQVIAGSETFLLVAPSLDAWLEFLLDGFESGRFIEDATKGKCQWVDTKFGDVLFSKETFAYYGERGIR